MGEWTLGAVLRENARSAARSRALVCGETTLSYAGLEQRAEALAAALSAAGVGPGDRIAWLGQNCHRWIESLFAAARLGAMLCSLNWRQPPADLIRVLGELEPRVVLWQAANLKQAATEIRSAVPGALWVQHDGNGPSDYEARLAAAKTGTLSHAERAGDAVLGLCVSSADGDSPVSMLSHANLLTPALLMGPLQEIDQHAVNLACAPLFHVAALFSIIPTLLFRGVNVMVNRADPEVLAAAIQAHRCTHGYILRPTAEALLAIARQRPVDLSTLRSNVDLPGWNELVTRDVSPWGRRTGGYGQTETQMAVLAPLGSPGASSTSGRAAPYAEVRIVDAANQETGVGEPGEIVVRGPSVHLGYWRRPGLNSRRFRGGWWHTGDAGMRDHDGNIAFIRPLGRMLKSGAENIYASEVERCLLEHPAVADVAVLGVPDDTWIQRVLAVVVLAEGASQTPGLEADLIAHSRARIAPFKIARAYVFQRDPLPRNDGLVDYALLDKIHGGGNYPGGETRST